MNLGWAFEMSCSNCSEVKDFQAKIEIRVEELRIFFKPISLWMEYSHDSALFLTNFSGHSAKFANFNHMVLKFNFMFKIIGVGHKEYQTYSTGGGAYFSRDR